MDFNNIKELITLISNSNLNEFELEKDSLKIKMSKGVSGEVRVVSNERIIPTQQEQREIAVEAVTSDVKVKEEIAEVDTKKEDDSNFEYINSPIVGTFYSSPSPDDPAFVKVGDVVSKGQPLCIIEAMKLMNEITAEVSGEIVEILVKNEEMVQYDQPIMKIRRK
ncbi:acetyl-CoA carboxylase biotin carboxyl carrier protein [Oceanirhabdus sp. W0125-5]|uniref:acetyl-CoA carboxylase biotin carboxyl carrier protein n=1 Tax=Oceanirhabdus sp. W0125-5 TaxID=2999116 RepID=UPI0022F32A84|nr:acetyl-CoA carboxylase biotin carboxyl carrier protein [Oceanirhabdus sp. W0125-5]WBW97657.1 acetyl-CoA carboxylase biotin carboxyl carrier protein [Oceanirhabdus sp. W0125-5]